MFKSVYKLLNPHRHNYKLVAVNDQYTTTFTDTKRKVTWSMRFYQCSCGRRNSKVTHDYAYADYLKHSGVDAAVQTWEEAGVVPKSSYDPVTNSYFVKPTSTEDEKVDPLTNLNKTVQDLCAMMNVVKRDYDLEKKYPKLKTAADNYNKLFDKYTTFESMKAGKDETSE